ncbi:hypothetical protein [Xanthomonas arboricola]|uniref:hypothetical protein n=1 Tax=Xanthomonas arboricola TaxID=56448 RepID=UPI0011AF035F|nr:hypothetical protein [Xanthomonas arboricola]
MHPVHRRIANAAEIAADASPPVCQAAQASDDQRVARSNAVFHNRKGSTLFKRRPTRRAGRSKNKAPRLRGLVVIYVLDARWTRSGTARRILFAALRADRI